jgi:putative Holliday junction resolvase
LQGCSFPPRANRARISSATPRVLRSASRYTESVTQSPSSQRDGDGARILAMDYGRARIGLAIADAVAGLPQPLGVLVRINRNEDMRRLREMVREHGVKRIVVGLPLRLDGTRGEMAEEAERFAQRVQKQIGVRVEMVDERLTSWEAERLLEEFAGRIIHAQTRLGTKRESNKKKQKKREEGKNSVDAIAAAVILREYLEGQRANDEKRGVEA